MHLLPAPKLQKKIPFFSFQAKVQKVFGLFLNNRSALAKTFISSISLASKNIYNSPVFQSYLQIFTKSIAPTRRRRYLIAAVIDVACITLLVINGMQPAQRLIEPLISPIMPLQTLTENKAKTGSEVFGFAPYWTFNNLDSVNFDVLTTFAYFGVDIDGQGDLDKGGNGYQTFKSKEATKVFKKAHRHGTRVVLTVTQMENAQIRALMDSPLAQERAINDMVAEVKDRGIDGINVDFEYMGNPGQDYRNKFTVFISNLDKKLKQEVPGSKLSISVYASAVKEPKIYDLRALGELDIKVFMMAYDFGYMGSDQVIPTSPLYGHSSGKYWYDVSTAVDDFLKQMPAQKLILGSAWYGYNYLIYGEPKVKAETRPAWSWRGRPTAQTYAIAKENVKPGMNGASDYKEGWDDEGKVGWKAYYSQASDAWRMIFIDDTKSLSYKYDFAKEKGLAGVGMWALGFEDNNKELWDLLSEKFGGAPLADRSFEVRIKD